MTQRATNQSKCAYGYNIPMFLTLRRFLYSTDRRQFSQLSIEKVCTKYEDLVLRFNFFLENRSAEQLLAVEAAEVRRKNSRRTDLTGRASTGAKGAWGSISRVFARNKHRRTLDPALYNGEFSIF